MSKKLNSYFLIFMVLFSLIPVQAAPPTKYYEIDSDVELRGAIFVNVDPSGFYTSFDNGIISINSIIHHEDVEIKFKGIALNAKLKKYNGFNIGYTHIDDNGEQTNIVKPLVIDNQGFAYLVTDFSTVIINGMTGTTTTPYTTQSNNQSFSVPNGSSYNLNITNKQAGVYSINGINWNYKLPFYQNTIDAFTDKQHEINNTNFPLTETIFNHIEVDGNGLPIINFTYSNNANIPFYIDYWDNISSFRGFIKTSSGIENLSLFGYYNGNSGLSNGNDGVNTFIQYHGTANTGYWDNNNIISPSNVVIEYDIQHTSGGTDILLGLANNAGYSDDAIGAHLYPTSFSRTWTKNEGSQIFGSSDSDYLGDGINHRIKIQLTNVLNLFIDGISVTDVNEPITADEDMSLFIYDVGTFISNIGFAYNYTLNKPDYTYGIEQQAYGIINITASITGDNNTQSYNTSQSREFTLTPTGTPNNVNINTSSTDYDITIITYWTDDTTLQSETATNGYAKQYINYTPIDYNVSADLNTTFTFDFSTQDYIGIASSTLNDVSKTTYINGQDVNASVGELIAGVNNWWNVTVLYNNIPTVSNQSDQTAYLGISKEFNDSTYNDPDNNPIATRLWEFGDGDTSSSSNPSHTYTTLGNLNANYTVTEDATTNSQTITKEFNVSVLVQPVQNLITEDYDQTWIKFNWSDYSSADYWNVSIIQNCIPKSNESFILDGVKDSGYDEVAHAYVLDTPNPVSDLNYEIIYWTRNNTHILGYADGYDNDVLPNDDRFFVAIDGSNDNLTTDDRKFILSESGTVMAQRWSGNAWLPQATNAEGFVVGSGVSGSIQYEMIIPVSEVNGFIDNATIKFAMGRTDSALNPDVVSFFPSNLINDTDATLWNSVELLDNPIWAVIGSPTASEYNSTGLTPYTWYKHRFVTINGSAESMPVYSTDITEDVPHYTISGYIKDTLGNIITTATVYSQNGIVGEATQSDINGFYEGFNFVTGNYSIYANKSGYQENFTDIYVTGNLTNVNVTLSAFIITDWEIYQELLLIQSQNDEILLNMSVNNTIVNNKLDTILIFILLNMAVIVGIITSRRGKENDN